MKYSKELQFSEHHRVPYIFHLTVMFVHYFHATKLYCHSRGNSKQWIETSAGATGDYDRVLSATPVSALLDYDNVLW